MDNNELDKILKEKLKNSILPPEEFKNKIKNKIEQEKIKINAKKFETKNQKINKIKYFSKYLSMVAMLIVIITVGVNVYVKDKENKDIVIIKTITPTKLESGAIANDSEFIIEVEGKNTNIQDVQKSLYVDPPIDYIIEKTSNKDKYKLKFKQNIPSSTIVKLQYIKDQITENSWAYQTSDKLAIIKTYPENQSFGVSENSTIEIEFSDANVENFEKHVEIVPNISGNWEHLGKVWRFTPEENMILEHEYIVNVKSGITANKKTINEDYKFSFVVGEKYNCLQQEKASIDGIITAKTGKKITIRCIDFSDNNNNNVKVEIGKFNNISDFEEYVETKNYSKANMVEEMNSKIQVESDYYKSIELKNSLSNGFYVAIVKNELGAEQFNCPIQISDYSAYVMETERDVLAWVAKKDELMENVEVEYLGRKIKTNSDGIAKFTEITDNSEEIKYLKIENELIIGVYNYSFERYPTAYLYTDKRLYKNTDTINVWGFIPKKMFLEKIENEFYIKLGNEKKHKINVDEDGNFKDVINIKNHITENIGVGLYYKDSEISSRYISIENYELQNYIYDVILDKNYAEEGEEIELKVKATHITGLIVPNKKITINTGENKEFYDKNGDLIHGNLITETTGEDGIAHFTVKINDAKDIESAMYPFYQAIEIYNGEEVEYNNLINNVDIKVLNRNVYSEDKSNNDTYRLELHKLANNKNIDIYNNLEVLYDGAYETEVNIRLKEEKSESYVSHYEYNEYTKENVPIYEIKELPENIINLKKVISKDGIAEISKAEIQNLIKENTENEIYFYSLLFEFVDLRGRKIQDEIYYENNSYFTSKVGYYWDNDSVEINTSDDRMYEINMIGSLTDNNMVYRYLLQHGSYKEYNIGENVQCILSESTLKGIKEIENDGKLLAIKFRERILGTNVTSENNINYIFENEDYIGFKTTSCYFIDGKFYRMPIEFFRADNSKKFINIEITSDKEEYKPGDTVNLDIKTTANNNPIKANLNISVVNEALFVNREDNTDILDTIWQPKGYATYTFSTDIDWLRNTYGGGAGGQGDSNVREKFEDTVYFEQITTNRNGEAKISFKLPDNITTYRITTHASNSDLYTGVNNKRIKSKKEFFIQSIEPRGIKNTDDVVLNVNSISENKYNIQYEFEIEEIGKKINTQGSTNSIQKANFGKLKSGIYHAKISGKSEVGEDTIRYEFKVAPSYQEIKFKKTVNIDNDTIIKPTKNPIVLEIYNKNMKNYIEYIDFIEKTVTSRLDTQIAYNKIQEIKEKLYGKEEKIQNIDLNRYELDGYFKNSEYSSEDLVLTALAKYYGNLNQIEVNLREGDNIFQYYLIKSAENKPVLNDLLYLKEEKNIDNYNKLLVTLSLEFLGDYQNAKELYSSIKLAQNEHEDFEWLEAIIETFISKENSKQKINDVINKNPSNEYIRFAILSYFNNNNIEIEQRENIKIHSNTLNEEIEINGIEIKTLYIYDEDLSNINFETQSKDLAVSYYYQTSFKEIENTAFTEDIKITGKGKPIVGNTIKLSIDFESNQKALYGVEYEGIIKIALPNSLRLALNTNDYIFDNGCYIVENNIETISVFKPYDCVKIELPLLVTNEGKYKIENIICKTDEDYHISNELEFEVLK